MLVEVCKISLKFRIRFVHFSRCVCIIIQELLIFYINATSFFPRKGNNQGDYPSDLNVFIGKEMLFKVEVTDGNLAHGWRNYSVKRSSDDVDLIGRFKVLHNAKVEESECLILSIID
jgi:hypothetical protein